LFVGDTLFAGSIGRTDLPGGNYDVLMRSITEVLFPLGDAAIVHPGHGPDTTIGRERATNPFVLEYFAVTGMKTVNPGRTRRPRIDHLWSGDGRHNRSTAACAWMRAVSSISSR